VSGKKTLKETQLYDYPKYLDSFSQHKLQRWSKQTIENFSEKYFSEATE